MNLGVFITALGSGSVEFFETAAIAYAISHSGYRREALWGTIAGLVIVGAIAAVLGTGLQYIPVHWLQIFIGAVLLWFGWGWFKKSVIRQAKHKRAGWVTDPLESEGIQLEKQQGFSRINFILMTKSSALEALEVALVVVSLGLASGAWHEALWGASIALVLTIGVVVMLHGYLIKLPEVLLKLSAGILLLAYGTFWLGEGMGWDWVLGEWMLLILCGLYSLVAFLAIRWLSKR